MENKSSALRCSTRTARQAGLSPASKSLQSPRITIHNLPKTGDGSNLLLRIALLFESGGTLEPLAMKKAYA
ncbi:MAG: hypothetical protein DBX40_03055 [Clostridiales bacterium]|nr:MAG: hypothetical protein DBX40_03055 [Clostridiales bacterium]